MKEITSCEVVNTEDNNRMTIIAEWLNDDVKIVLLRSGITPLIGETTMSNLCDYSKTTKTREESSREIRIELSGRDKDVQFSLRETKFIWKKKIWKKGTLEMQPIQDIATLGSMNIEWLGKYSRLQTIVSKLQEDNEALVKTKNELISQIKEMEQIKKSMEDTLYKHFLLLLNSKKRRIRELEEKLSTQVPNEQKIYEANTDESENEEEEKVSPSRKKLKQEQESSPVASSSKKIVSTPLKFTPESDDEIVLRYDESPAQNLKKLNTEEESEEDLFSQ